jgi:hypothetical protein
LGLAKTELHTLFDEEEGVKDEEAPGSFRRPDSAYRLAKIDLNSELWQTEIDGLDAIVRLIRWHPEIITEDMRCIMTRL